jgi:type II secretory pathway component PulM
VIAIWDHATARERLFLACAAVAFVAVLVYQFALAPLAGHLARSEARAAQARELARWMESAPARRRGLTAAAAPVDPQTLLGRLEAGLQAAGLRDQMTAITPTAPGAVRVQFTAVHFNAWSQWLIETTHTLGVVITEVELRADVTPGQVQGVVALATPAPQ